MTTITRACEHAGINYSEGDQVDDHDVAEHLVRLGFAVDSEGIETRTIDAGTLADPTATVEVTPPARPAARGQNKEG